MVVQIARLMMCLIVVGVLWCDSAWSSNKLELVIETDGLVLFEEIAKNEKYFIEEIKRVEENESALLLAINSAEKKLDASFALNLAENKQASGFAKKMGDAHEAAEYAVEKISRLIETGGCNINAKDNKGKTPLFRVLEVYLKVHQFAFVDQYLPEFRSIISKLAEIAEDLIEKKGADMNVIVDRESILDLVIRPGYKGFFEKFLIRTDAQEILIGEHRKFLEALFLKDFLDFKDFLDCIVITNKQFPGDVLIGFLIEKLNKDVINKEDIPEVLDLLKKTGGLIDKGYVFNKSDIKNLKINSFKEKLNKINNQLNVFVNSNNALMQKANEAVSNIVKVQNWLDVASSSSTPSTKTTSSSFSDQILEALQLLKSKLILLIPYLHA